MFLLCGMLRRKVNDLHIGGTTVTGNFPILVTGATGNTGAALLSRLTEHNIPCKAGVRKKRDTLHTEQVLLDFQRPETFASALKDVKGVFLLRPPAISNVKTTLNVFLDVAAQMDVEHVVFVSVSGAEDNKMVPHHGVEQHLIHGPLSYTILRPGFFVQNIGDAYRYDIVNDDRIYLPVGDTKGVFIDTRDIAEVAYQILLAPELHHRKAYTLTGQTLVSFDDIASMLTESLGRKITYQSCSAWHYFWHLRRKHQLPWMQCFIQTLLHVQFSRGGAAHIDPMLPELLGHTPTTLQSYIAEHTKLWQRPSPK